MNHPSITAIIPHYFNQRASSLVAACDALMRGSVTPDEILVWNNDQPLGFTMPDVHVIQSHRNVGPQARFLAALAATGDLVFFQDNDVAVQRKTLQHLREQLLDDVDQVLVSMEGRRLTDGRYRTSTWLRPGIDRARADISLGRGELVDRAVLQEALGYFPWGPRGQMDDLCFSHGLQQAKVPIWVVPARDQAGMTQLSEGGVGARMEERHYQTRDLLCRQYWPFVAANYEIQHQREGGPCGS